MVQVADILDRRGDRFLAARPGPECKHRISSAWTTAGFTAQGWEIWVSSLPKNISRIISDIKTPDFLATKSITLLTKGLLMMHQPPT
jgi:hypothetical protein